MKKYLFAILLSATLCNLHLATGMESDENSNANFAYAHYLIGELQIELMPYTGREHQSYLRIKDLLNELKARVSGSELITTINEMAQFTDAKRRNAQKAFKQKVDQPLKDMERYVNNNRSRTHGYDDWYLILGSLQNEAHEIGYWPANLRKFHNIFRQITNSTALIHTR